VRRNIRHSAQAISTLFIIIIVVASIAVVALCFAPSGSCNVAATVKMSEINFVIGGYYSVNGVSAVNAGYSSIINLGTLGLTPPALTYSYDLTITIAGHTAQKDESKILPTLSIGANSVTDTVTIGYIPPGEQTVLATLTINGAQQGSATTNINVGCPGW